MPRIFLHIGAHKTGTTSVQSFLANNSAFLQSHGCTYPHICWYQHGQHRLAFAAKGSPDPEVGDYPQLVTEISALREFMVTCKEDVILSSESFFALPSEKLRELKTGLADWDVQVLASVRRQDNLFESIYNQKTKNGWNHQKRPIAFYVKEPRSFSRDLDLYGCLSSWASVFGREKINAYCFESGEAVAMFLGILGLPVPQQAETAKHLNVAVPAKVLELVRLVKTVTDDRVVQYLALEAARKTFAGTSSMLLGVTDRARILKCFEEDNEKLFSEFIGGDNIYAEKHWGAEFQKPGMEAADTLSKKDVVQVMVAMAQAFAQENNPSNPQNDEVETPPDL